MACAEGERGGVSDYATFLEQKALTVPPCGLSAVPPLADHLFSFQRDIVSWALRRGRAAVFADCGLGKTLIELEWGRHLPGDVLLLAPLAVAQQIEREAVKFHIPSVVYRRSQDSVTSGVTVANYE